MTTHQVRQFLKICSTSDTCSMNDIRIIAAGQPILINDPFDAVLVFTAFKFASSNKEVPILNDIEVIVSPELQGKLDTIKNLVKIALT